MAYLETANWQQLGQHQFRKWDVGPMMWDEDTSLDQFIVAVGKYGGPIATARDPTKMIRVRGSSKGIDDICIFEPTGRLIKAVPSRSEGTIRAMGWTSVREDLVVVYSNGHVDVYNVRGERRDVSFALFDNDDMTAETSTVHLAHVSDRGVAAVIKVGEDQLQLVIVGAIEDGFPVTVEGAGLIAAFPPLCINVIEPEYTETGELEVLLGTDDCSILVATASDGSLDQGLQEKLTSPVHMMAVSPNGRYVALVGGDVLTVMGTNFETKLLEFNTASELPAQVLWCAEDAVVMVWPGKGLLAVGPYGDWMKYPYEDEVAYIAGEPDCVRVFTGTKQEILQRVPAETDLIRKIGSDAPSAMLFDAMESFENGDAKADDNVRQLQQEETLMNAVRGCVSAASFEWDTMQQRNYLKAASYGKNFDSDGDASVHALFVDVCRKLRVLNHLRAPEYDKLTPDVVIDRLVNRHHHRVALLLCDYLKMDKDRVLVHWACAKIRAARDMTDEDVCNLIKRRLVGTSGRVSYADIAATADAAGRKRLATMLLDCEPRAADKVPLLLKMKEVDLALRKAIDSGDTDLVYLVLLHLKRSMTGPDKDPRQFFAIVCKKEYEEAVNLLIDYCKTQDRVLLKKLYYFTRRFYEAGQLCIEEAYKCRDLAARVALLQDAAEIFKTGVSNGVKDLGFHRKATLDQVKLLKLQNALEEENPGTIFVDRSIAATLFNLIILGMYKQAQKLRDEFKVAPASYWQIKVSALAKRGKWETLARFAAEKKSPIGYKPFADVCLEHKHPEEAAQYIERFTDIEDKIDYFMRIEMWNEAADLAIKAKDHGRMHAIRRACPIAGVLAKLDAAL